MDYAIVKPDMQTDCDRCVSSINDRCTVVHVKQKQPPVQSQMLAR